MARSAGDIVLTHGRGLCGASVQSYFGRVPHHHHQEPVARCPRVFQGVNPARDWGGLWSLQQGTLFFFLDITSLLNILELPRLSEARQPKGISPLTCEVKIL